MNQNEEVAVAWSLKGRIQIKERKYDAAIECFKKAISIDPYNIKLFLWNEYAEYLKIEFESCIEVGKHINIKEISEETYETIRQIKYQEGITTIIGELERRLKLSGKNTERDLREFILYFLGYLYYKSNDIIKAKEKLEECIKLESRRTKLREFADLESRREEFCRFVNSGLKWRKFKRFFTAKSMTERDARELLDYLLKYKIKHLWWNWWWSSPIHRWLKRAIFALLSYPILSILLHPFIQDLIFFIAKWVPLINEKSFSSIFILIFNNENSVFYINNGKNFVYILIKVSISVFFLLSPVMYRFRVEGIEVELPPSHVEITFSPPSLERWRREP